MRLGKQSRWRTHETTCITRDRCILSFCLLAAVFIGYGVYLLFIQVFEHKRLYEKGKEIRTWREVLEARRGRIFSREMGPLAVSAPVYSVCANPQEVKDVARTAARLSRLLSVPYPRLYRKLGVRIRGAKPVLFVWLKRKVDDKTAKSIADLVKVKRVKDGKKVKKVKELPGVFLKQECKRIYPCRALAGQLLGFVDLDNIGRAGLESSWNRELSGYAGWRKQEVDLEGRPLPNSLPIEVPPTDGKDLVLTIDHVIQAHVEEVLDRLVENYHPNFATAIVMRVSTGEILSMATRPGFDPNRYADYFKPNGNAKVKSTPEARGGSVDELPWRRNQAVSFAYEPGSTFKLITACAVLDGGMARPDDTEHCEGNSRVQGEHIKCWVYTQQRCAHGAETLSEAIRDSCNIAIFRFGMRLPRRTFVRYLLDFGLTLPTGSRCGQEAIGRLRPIRDWERDNVHYANLCFGQGINVTPLQLVTAVCTIANGGVRMKPYVVKEVRDESRGEVKEFKPQAVKRVISPTTARAVLAMMRRVVTEGTGKKAAVAGYSVAGKTGSASKAVRLANGRWTYNSGKFVGSFVGVIPAEHPQVGILVVVDEPKGVQWGGQVAAPAFADIARRVVWRLNIKPTHPSID